MTDANDRSAYWRDVRSYAEAVVEAVRDHGQDVEDAIHEAADGSWWVIYTHAAHMVWQYSDAADAIHELGSDWAAGLDTPESLFPRIAYYAIAQDIRDELDRVGFDLDAEEDEEDEDA